MKTRRNQSGGEIFQLLAVSSECALCKRARSSGGGGGGVGGCCSLSLFICTTCYSIILISPHCIAGTFAAARVLCAPRAHVALSATQSSEEYANMLEKYYILQYPRPIAQVRSILKNIPGDTLYFIACFMERTGEYEYCLCKDEQQQATRVIKY